MPITQGRAARHGGARSANHTALVKACLHYLKLQKIPAWSNNTGAFRTESGGFVRVSFPGCADIIGIIPGPGKLVAVECKTGRGELTEKQEAFRKLVDESGGKYIVARSVGDLWPAVRYAEAWSAGEVG